MQQSDKFNFQNEQKFKISSKLAQDDSKTKIFEESFKLGQDNPKSKVSDDNDSNPKLFQDNDLKLKVSQNDDLKQNFEVSSKCIHCSKKATRLITNECETCYRRVNRENKRNEDNEKDEIIKGLKNENITFQKIIIEKDLLIESLKNELNLLKGTFNDENLEKNILNEQIILQEKEKIHLNAKQSKALDVLIADVINCNQFNGLEKKEAFKYLKSLEFFDKKKKQKRLEGLSQERKEAILENGIDNSILSNIGNLDTSSRQYLRMVKEVFQPKEEDISMNIFFNINYINLFIKISTITTLKNATIYNRLCGLRILLKELSLLDVMKDFYLEIEKAKIYIVEKMKDYKKLKSEERRLDQLDYQTLGRFPTTKELEIFFLKNIEIVKNLIKEDDFQNNLKDAFLLQTSIINLIIVNCFGQRSQVPLTLQLNDYKIKFSSVKEGEQYSIGKLYPGPEKQLRVDRGGVEIHPLMIYLLDFWVYKVRVFYALESTKTIFIQENGKAFKTKKLKFADQNNMYNPMMRFSNMDYRHYSITKLYELKPNESLEKAIERIYNSSIYCFNVHYNVSTIFKTEIQESLEVKNLQIIEQSKELKEIIQSKIQLQEDLYFKRYERVAFNNKEHLKDLKQHLKDYNEFFKKTKKDMEFFRVLFFKEEKKFIIVSFKDFKNYKIELKQFKILELWNKNKLEREKEILKVEKDENFLNWYEIIEEDFLKFPMLNTYGFNNLESLNVPKDFIKFETLFKKRKIKEEFSFENDEEEEEEKINQRITRSESKKLKKNIFFNQDISFYLFYDIKEDFSEEDQFYEDLEDFIIQKENLFIKEEFKPLQSLNYDEKLKFLNLKEKSTLPNGNCGFECLGYILNMNHLQVRNLCIQILIEKDELSKIQYPIILLSSISEENIIKNSKEYLDLMSIEFTWITSTEIILLANKMNLKIIQIGNDLIKERIYNEKGKNLFYIGFNRNHYTYLEKI